MGPNALRITSRIGKINELILEKGFIAENLQALNAQGKFLGTMLQGSRVRFGFPSVRFPREILRTALLKELEHQGIEIVYEKKLVKITEDDAGITIEFADGSSVWSDIVVGADGIWSSIRTQVVNPNIQPEFYGVLVLYGMMTESQMSQMYNFSSRLPKPSILFGLDGSFALWPTDTFSKELAYIVNVDIDSKDREGWARFAKDKEGMRRILQDIFCRDDNSWHPEVQALCNKTPAENFLSWP